MKKILIGLTIGLILGLGISLLAWINPSGSPPTGGGVIQTQNTGLFINTSTYFTSGNVGIGTTSPMAKLDVEGDIDIAPYYWLKSGGVNLLQYGGADNSLWLRCASDKCHFQNAAGTSEFLTINSGNVGIGTTAPSQKLTVAGNIGIQAGASSFIGTLDNYALSLRTNNTDRIFITNTGNVGIGTTAPGAKLDVNGNLFISGISGDVFKIKGASIPMGLSTEVGGTTPLLNLDINFRQSDKNTAYVGGAFRIDARSPSQPLFQFLARQAGSTVDSVLMSITESGNVGIGTTNPGQKLEVAGNASIGYISGSEGGVFITKTSQYGAPSIQGVTNTFAPGNLAINPVGGNVGIGTTTPRTKLDVNGSAIFSSNVTIGFPSLRTDFTLAVNGSILAQTGIALNLASADASTIPVCRNNTNVLSYCPSSIRYKKNISNFVVEKNKVFQLVPKKFQWKNSEKWDFGLIAEEVLKVYPELVTYNDKNEIEGVKYEKIGTLLVPIVKEHDEKIMFLEKIIEEQQKEIEELRRLIK